jgi:diacylglycerol kinase (ATP)
MSVHSVPYVADLSAATSSASHRSRMSKPFYIILNPVAGKGAAIRAAIKLSAALDRLGAGYEVGSTRKPRHGIELARRAAESGAYSAVVAVGGDGTVHEVANGLLRASDPEPTLPMGIVPAGSGNDFARLAGSGRTPRQAAGVLVTGTVRSVDVGRVNETHYFTNGIGAGFDARVAFEARGIRYLRGVPLYAVALVKMLPTYRAVHMRIEADGEVLADRPMTLATVGNGGRHGGGFWICPDARVDDGVLDLCLADALTPLKILGFVPSVLRGTHVGREGVDVWNVRKVLIQGAEPFPVHADGEILYEAATELRCEVLPGRLRVLSPQGGLFGD